MCHERETKFINFALYTCNDIWRQYMISIYIYLYIYYIDIFENIIIICKMMNSWWIVNIYAHDKGTYKEQIVLIYTHIHIYSSNTMQIQSSVVWILYLENHFIRNFSVHLKEYDNINNIYSLTVLCLRTGWTWDFRTRTDTIKSTLWQ